VTGITHCQVVGESGGPELSVVDVSQKASPRSGARVVVQKLGTSLSNMVMPNIGAFIAWGLITALFIKTGWLTGIFHGLQDPNGWVAKIGGWGAYESGGIVGPMPRRFPDRAASPRSAPTAR